MMQAQVGRPAMLGALVHCPLGHDERALLWLSLPPTVTQYNVQRAASA